MRHNNLIGWRGFLEALEKIESVSPWLSRQITKRAREWPFWYSGPRIREWQDLRVWLNLPVSSRNSIEGEICQGHLVLTAEFALRLLFLRKRQEFPIHYRFLSASVQVHNRVDQPVDIKLEIPFVEWERIRLELARTGAAQAEFPLSALLGDGRLAASFNFQVGFELEKFLPA